MRDPCTGAHRRRYKESTMSPSVLLDLLALLLFSMPAYTLLVKHTHTKSTMKSHNRGNGQWNRAIGCSSRRRPIVSARKGYVGIDLGTSNSAIAMVEGGRPVIVPQADGSQVFKRSSSSSSVRENPDHPFIPVLYGQFFFLNPPPSFFLSSTIRFCHRL